MTSCFFPISLKQSIYPLTSASHYSLRAAHWMFLPCETLRPTLSLLHLLSQSELQQLVCMLKCFELLLCDWLIRYLHEDVPNKVAVSAYCEFERFSFFSFVYFYQICGSYSFPQCFAGTKLEQTRRHAKYDIKKKKNRILLLS